MSKSVAVEFTDKHEALRLDLLAAIDKHESEIPRMESMLVMAQFLGQLIATQDLTIYDPVDIQQHVNWNIQQGVNQTIVAAQKIRAESDTKGHM